MKKIFSIFFILLSIKAYSQNTNPQFLGGANSNLIVQGIMNLADSPRASLNWILTDTNTAKSYFFTKLKGRWAREANGRLYYNPTGSRFVLADSVTGGGGVVDSNIFATVKRLADTSALLRSIIGTGGIDTSSLSNRINDRVKYSDTAAMLAPYALTSELTNQSGDAGNLQNLHITGTNGAGYLLLRHQASNPTATGSTSVVFADANGDLKWKNDNKFYTTLRDYKNTADRVYSFEDKSYTLADSAVVAAKLNITDTANIRLRPIAGANMTITGTYPNLTFASSGGGGAFYDSVTMATNYGVDTAKVNLRTLINSKLSSADTASISTRIDARVKYSDTAAMLAPYATDANVALKLNISDTATMLGGYLRKADTSTLSNRINLKANTASPTFTGTVTIPTGANITTPNILGLTSGSTNDSIVVADPSTGALKRISSSRIGSGGGGADSITFATNYRVDTAKVNLRTLINSKLNIADPTATGTLTVPAITITGLSAGSASDSVVTINASTGVLYRRSFPSGSSSSGWGLTGNNLSSGNFIGSNNSFPLIGKVAGFQIFNFATNDGFNLGSGSSASGIASVAIGVHSGNSGIAGIALGYQASVNGVNNGIALGRLCQVNHQGAYVSQDYSGSNSVSSGADNEWKAKFNGGFIFQTGTSIHTTQFTIKTSGIINITNCPVYVDNAAALSGGLVAGDIYRKSTGELMIVY